MKVKTIALVILGVLIGWCTVPLLHADSDSNTYKALLRKIIGIMEEIKAIDQQTAANTTAIKDKLGAK